MMTTEGDEGDDDNDKLFPCLGSIHSARNSTLEPNQQKILLNFIFHLFTQIICTHMFCDGAKKSCTRG